jgi:hypothetical protein
MVVFFHLYQPPHPTAIILNNVDLINFLESEENVGMINGDILLHIGKKLYNMTTIPKGMCSTILSKIYIEDIGYPPIPPNDPPLPSPT